MSTAMRAILTSLLVHLAAGLLAVAAVGLAAKGQGALSADLQQRLADNPGGLAIRLEDARAALMLWAAAALACAFVCATGWLLLVDRLEPLGDAETRRPFGGWVGGLLLSLGLLGLTAWAIPGRRLAFDDLAPGATQAAVAAVLIATLAGYWIATALGVKRVLRPAVPLADALVRG